MAQSKWFIILVSGLVIFGTACGARQATEPFAASDPQSVAGNTIAPVASSTRINGVTSDPESMADNTVTPVTSATPANTPIPTPARPEGSINLIEYNEKVTNNEIGPILGAAEAANQTIQLVFESRAGELILNYVNLSPDMRTMRETELLNNLAEQTVLHGGTGRSDGNYIFQISLIHEVNGENVMFTPRLDAEGRTTGVVDEIHQSALQVLGLNMSDLVFDPNALPILDGGNNVKGWIADFVIPGIESGRPAGILSRQTPAGEQSAINLIPGNYTPEQTQFFPPEVPDGLGEILWYMNSGEIGRAHGYDLDPDLTWQDGEWVSTRVDFESVVYEENTVTEVYLMDGDLEINPDKKEEMFRETWEAWAASAFSRDYLLAVYGYIPTTVEQIQSVQYEGLPAGQLPVVINEGHPDELQFPLIFFYRQQLRLKNFAQGEDEDVLARLRATGISTNSLGIVGYDRHRTVNNTNGLTTELDKSVGGYGQITSSPILGFGLSLTPDGHMIINAGSLSLTEYPHLKNVIVRGDGNLEGDATAMTFLYESLVLVYREGKPNVVICGTRPGQKDSNCDGYPQLAFLNSAFEEKYGDPDNPNLGLLPFRPSVNR